MQKYFFLFVFLLAGCTVFGEIKLSEAETPVPRYNGSNPKEKWWRGRLDRAEEKAAKDGKTIRLVFIGDSITHNLGKKENSAIWDEFAYCNPLNLGFGGDRTMHTLWIAENSPLFDSIEPKLIVLLIGTNNYGWRSKFSAEDTSRAIEKIVLTLRRKEPQAKILLFGIFPRGEKPGNEYRKVNEEVNRRIRTLADGETVFFEDIGEKFLEKDGTLPKSLFPDSLHPNAAGYRIWFDAIRPYVHRYIGKPAL